MLKFVGWRSLMGARQQNRPKTFTIKYWFGAIWWHLHANVELREELIVLP